MNNKIRLLLLVGVFLLCIMVINQYVFPLGWTCSCFTEDLGRYQCREQCGSEANCDGWSWETEGLCYLGWCFMDGAVFCSDSGIKPVTFISIECMECVSPGW